MSPLRILMGKINGSGWLVGIVVNTLALAALYWGVILRLDRIEARQEVYATTQAEIRTDIRERLATKAEVVSLWNLGQEQHESMRRSIAAIDKRQDDLDQWWLGRRSSR